MRNATRVFLILFITTLIFSALAFGADLKGAFDSLVQAERGFARLSVEKGMRDAFLANLNDQSILFRPQAVPGKAWMEKSPPIAAQLSWEPAFADIAKSGDLGYTTGPWQVRRTPNDTPADFGHYVTIWKKQSDGAWKIVLDIGISHPMVPKPATVSSPPIGTVIEKRLSEPQIQRARDAIRDLERRFPTSGETYPGRFDLQGRLYRNGSAPFVGQAAVTRALAVNKDAFTWSVQAVDVSGAGDLGFAYGTVQFKQAEKPASYLRIWKRVSNGEWKVVLDLIG